jgi:prepilin-type N-terminal cleavage/methylation domain-containing protein
LQSGAGNAKGVRRGRSKPGFTLVEVIVVIVIIAILAAIGVPALTGYIDKAQDRKWIAEARNYLVAGHTVIDEAYADGEFRFNSEYPETNTGNTYLDDYISEGDNVNEYLRCFELDRLGTFAYDDSEGFYNRVAALLGEETREELSNRDEGDNPYTWTFYFIGSPNSTAINADGGLLFVYLEEETVVVTYKIDKVDSSKKSVYNGALDNSAYDPDAGYKVYHNPLD